MIVTAKYGILATESNLDGSDMVAAAFSDVIGGTTNVTLTEGDVVGVVDVGESGVFIELWLVHDGSPWEPGTTLLPGDILLAIGTEVPYQQGAGSVVLDDGSIASLNLGVTMSLLPA